MVSIFSVLWLKARTLYMLCTKTATEMDIVDDDQEFTRFELKMSFRLAPA